MSSSETGLRASRLLHTVLLLQNRGRMTAGELAGELEVARRTVLRDVDAMTEAGLPIVTFPGQGGGIELGFDYRTRLTGLDRGEAEAMGLILSCLPAGLARLGLANAGRRAAAKVWEAFPHQTRAEMTQARDRFRLTPTEPEDDPRLPALARAIREHRVIRLCAQTQPEIVHPVGLDMNLSGWWLRGACGGTWERRAWGVINISAHRFAASTAPGGPSRR